MQSVRHRIGWVLLLLGVAVSCGLCLVFSHRDFSGFDLSPMIDAGWRVIEGQVPGKDFIVTFPASLYLLTAGSFRIFGVTWHGLALTTCAVCVTLCLLGMRVASILGVRWGRAVALQVATVYVASQCILLVSINVVWHSSLAESFGIYAVLTTAALLSLSEEHVWLRRELTGHLVLASTALILSKPNTAYPALALCLFALHRGNFRPRYWMGVLAAAFLLASIPLAVVHVSLWGMLEAYVGLSGRLLPKPLVVNLVYQVEARNGLAELVVYAVLLFGLKEFVTSIRRDWRGMLSSPLEVLAVGSAVVGLLGMATNFDVKLTDTPLVLMGMMLFCTTSVRATRSQLWTTRNALIFLCLVAVYFGRVRIRMQSVGNWAAEGCTPKVWIDDRFLGHMKVCPVVVDSLTEIDNAMARVPAGDHVFFGPALEFLYARDRTASPEHLPNWWDAGTSFARSKSNTVLKAWRDDHFDVLIFVAGAKDPLLPGMIDDIRNDYVMVPGPREIEVYVRRGESLRPASP